MNKTMSLKLEENLFSDIKKCLQFLIYLVQSLLEIP